MRPVVYCEQDLRYAQDLRTVPKNGCIQITRYEDHWIKIPLDMRTIFSRVSTNLALPDKRIRLTLGSSFLVFK